MTKHTFDNRFRYSRLHLIVCIVNFKLVNRQSIIYREEIVTCDCVRWAYPFISAESPSNIIISAAL